MTAVLDPCTGQVEKFREQNGLVPELARPGQVGNVRLAEACFIKMRQAVA